MSSSDTLAYRTCGGTGMDNGSIEGPDYRNLPADLRPDWDRQMRNRPEIHRAIDLLLDYRFEERLGIHPSLGELVKYRLERAMEDVADVEAAAQMPKAERGRIFRDILLGIFKQTADEVWFHAQQGYPTTGSITRLKARYEANREGDVDDEDDDGPGHNYTP